MLARGHTLFARLLVSAVALLLVIGAIEICLRIINRPYLFRKHTETRRFMLTDKNVNGMPVYVNHPGRIIFTYDGNPRGYFGPNNELCHEVNPDGFRGRSFGTKQPGVRRLLFLGDSFTFGEGVRLEDTYPERVAGYLTCSGNAVEACNLGVGGYNTTQSAHLLQLVGLNLQPDAVILGYVPNDAEPPLFLLDPKTGTPIRRNREAFIEAEGSPQAPPDSILFRLRVAQLAWQFLRHTRLTRQTVSYYRSLYAPGNAGRHESERALREIIGTCHENGIPCIVVIFPILHKLSNRYPFTEIHKLIGNVVRDAGGTVVDLMPALRNKDARELWVHPTDQHPNERAHAIAGELVAQSLREALNSLQEQPIVTDNHRSGARLGG